jgi:transcriptional pleiotropic regulator of transition state genes
VFDEFCRKVFDKKGDRLLRPIGVVRKVDQLGRIVLPKSLRKKFSMNEGDPIEIVVTGEQIILEKYRPRCSFCNSQDHVQEFKDRFICLNCLVELQQYLK